MRARDATLRDTLGTAVEPGPTGVRVVAVDPGSPAAAAGLAAGDEIVRVDEVTIASPNELFVRTYLRVGRGTVRLSALRGYDVVDVTLRWQASAENGPRVGRPAPDFAAPRSRGPFPASLARLRGQVVLLDFSATWCKPCRALEPRLAALHGRHAAAGLRIVSLYQEPFDRVAARFERDRLPHTLGDDERGAIALRYAVGSYPTLVLIDRAGVVRRVMIGADGDLEGAVAALLR